MSITTVFSWDHGRDHYRIVVENGIARAEHYCSILMVHIDDHDGWSRLEGHYAQEALVAGMMQLIERAKAEGGVK